MLIMVGVFMEIDYAEKVKEYRQNKFLTQEEMAKLLGVTLVSVCRWETGKCEPTIKMKKKLYELFKDANMNLEE